MTALADFLLARIAEDEQAARPEQGYTYYGPLARRFDAARVLAECGARRRIVEWVQWDDSGMDADAWIVCKKILRELASVYAEHPDYDEAWSV